MSESESSREDDSQRSSEVQEDEEIETRNGSVRVILDHSKDKGEKPVPEMKRFHPHTSEHHAKLKKDESRNATRERNKSFQKHSMPTLVISEMQEKFGRPDDMCRSVAIWSRDNLRRNGYPMLERIEIRRDGVEHHFPVPHFDHAYLTIKIKIPRDKVWDVLSISDSLTYDRVSHELTSRCAGWRTNVATLFLAARIANGHASLKEMQERNVMEKMINKAAENVVTGERYLMRLGKELK